MKCSFQATMAANVSVSAGLEPVKAYRPKRIAPTTMKDPINDLAEVERWGRGALEDVTGVLADPDDEFTSR
jgi:hypothetical protein